MSDEGALFDAPPAVPARSPDQRRTDRQAEAIRRGQHPLAVALGRSIPLHPDADRDASSTDNPRLPLRCGTCTFRGVSRYPKCWHSDRVTAGPGTDVRAWWPACTDYPAVPA